MDATNTNNSTSSSPSMEGALTTMENHPYREVYYTKVVLDDPSEHQDDELLYVTSVVFNDPPGKEFRIGKTTFSVDFYSQIATAVTELTNLVEFPTERAAAERVKKLKLCCEERFKNKNRGINSPRVMKSSNAKKHSVLFEGEISNTSRAWESELETNFCNTMAPSVNQLESEVASEGAWTLEAEKKYRTAILDCLYNVSLKVSTVYSGKDSKVKKDCFLFQKEVIKDSEVKKVQKHRLLFEKALMNTNPSCINETETNLINTDELLVDLIHKGSVERKFRLGKTSYGKEFFPKCATVVTEVIDHIEFPSERAAAERVAYLKECRSAYVARASNAMKHRILLEEEVGSTVQSWINEMETKYIKIGGSWFYLIWKDLFKSFQEFALGLKRIHNECYVFEGSLEDVIKTPTCVKLLKVRKLKNAGEFDLRKAMDCKRFIALFYDCLYKPANVSNSWAITHSDSSEVKQLGISAEVLDFVTQLENIEKDVERVPLYLLFENPIFYDINQRRAYMKKFIASLAAFNT